MCHKLCWRELTTNNECYVQIKKPKENTVTWKICVSASIARPRKDMQLKEKKVRSNVRKYQTANRVTVQSCYECKWNNHAERLAAVCKSILWHRPPNAHYPLDWIRYLVASFQEISQGNVVFRITSVRGDVRIETYDSPASARSSARSRSASTMASLRATWRDHKTCQHQLKSPAVYYKISMRSPSIKLWGKGMKNEWARALRKFISNFWRLLRTGAQI